MSDSSKRVFEVIDEIRRGLGLSVSEVCGYELSERTYYRYLKGTTQVKDSNLISILDKLGITFGQLSSFLFSLGTNNSNNVKFVVRIALNHVQDIEKYYKNYGFESDYYVDKPLFDCFYNIYRFYNNEINRDELLAYFTYAASHYSSLSLKDNRELIIKTLYAIFSDNIDDVSSLVEHYLHNDHKFYLILFTIVLGHFIFLLMEKGDRYDKEIRLLIERYLNIYHELEYVRATTFASLFLAYISEGKEREMHLYNFFSFIRYENVTEQDLKRIRKVEKIFNVKEKELNDKITLEDVINLKINSK